MALWHPVTPVLVCLKVRVHVPYLCMHIRLYVYLTVPVSIMDWETGRSSKQIGIFKDWKMAYACLMCCYVAFGVAHCNIFLFFSTHWAICSFFLK